MFRPKKLRSRMSFIFKRSSKSSSSKTDSSSSSSKVISSSKRSNKVEGADREKAVELFRPPLVEGRAQIQTDVFEYIPGTPPRPPNPDLSDSLKKLEVEDSADPKESFQVEEEERETLRGQEEGKQPISPLAEDMGSPKLDRTSGEINVDLPPISTPTPPQQHEQQQQQQQQSEEKGEPSKLGNTDKSTATAAADNSSPHTGSENSRGYEPEGSNDMSSPSDTPSYTRWADSINNLLEDDVGADLFLEYLKQQQLDKYILFWAFCNGFKDIPEEKLLKVSNFAYRKYIAPSKTGQPLLDCLDDNIRETIKQKITSGDGFDRNVFDGAQQQVVDHMARTSYIKFFESDVYINHIQTVQNVADMSEVNSSKQHSGTQSSASSVSGKDHHIQRPIPIHSDVTSSNKPSSGSSRVKSSKTSTASDQNSSSRSSSAASTLTPFNLSSAAADPSTATASDMLQHLSLQQQSQPMLHQLDPVDENTVWSANSNNDQLRKSKGVSLSSGNLMQGHHTQRFPSRPPRGSGSPLFPVGGSSEPYPYPLLSASAAPSAPYHAMSSTYNPVSRNDSEIQSQSSGAMGGGGNGDTTDDGNYSSFTEMSSSQFSNNKAINTQAEQKRQQHIMRQQQNKQVMKNMPSTDVLPKAKKLTTRAGETAPPQQSPADFHKILVSKLNILKQQLEKDRQFRQQMARCESVASGPARSQHYNDESDQSILDDHCDRVFNKKTPMRSPPTGPAPNASMNMSSMSLGATANPMMSASFGGVPSGHQTWAGHRSSRSQQHQHQQQYKQFGSHYPQQQQQQMTTSYPHSSSSLQQQQQQFMPQDLQYFPHDTSATLNQRNRALAAAAAVKTFSDFGGSESLNRGVERGIAHHRMQQQQHQQMQQPQQHGPHVSDRVQNWVHAVNNNPDQWSASGSVVAAGGGNNNDEFMHHQQQHQHRAQARATSMNRNISKTSPRSSARQQGKRSKSQERQQQQQPAPYNMYFQQQQQPPLPRLPSSTQSSSVTTILFTYPHSKDKNQLPYVIKCPEPHITFRRIKELCPKKAHYRYFFKTIIEGMESLCEEYDDDALVPVLGTEQKKIVVECRENDA